MPVRSRQTIRLTVFGVVLFLVASVAVVSLQSEPVEASRGPITIETPSELSSAIASLLPAPAIASAAPAGADGIGLVDPTSGVWHLRTRAGDPASFYFGIPGDYPMIGDWNCDGIDTPGLYRQSDGYVYLRNSNTQGIADIKFYFGDPGDIPLAGDFSGDGCDTVSIYRQSEGRVYIINKLGQNDGGLGAADYSYYFGDPGDKPFAGDFNGNGIDTVGLHRESSGLMYFRNTNTQGNAEFEFYFGNPGDRLIAGDWIGTGSDSPGIYRPSNRNIYLRYTNTQGNANEAFPWGESPYIPVSGNFGTLNSGVDVILSGAPDGLKWAVESFYQELPSAPHLPTGLRNNLNGLYDRPKSQTVTGSSSTSTAYGKQVGVVTAGSDILLAVSDNGWEWRVVGAQPSSVSRARWYGNEPRFVTLIGADWQASGDNWPSSTLMANADSVHIYSVVPSTGKGAIVGFPRDTLVRASFGEVKIANTMTNHGPQYTVDALRRETNLPIEGFFHIGLGSSIGGGNPPPGFIDLVDAYDGFPFTVPYDSGGIATEGDTFVNGGEALAVARNRQTVPHGDPDRSLAQGLLLKAGIAEVKSVGILVMPSLLAMMDDYVKTDLSVDDIVTLAASVYVVDPGPMPTLTGADLEEAGHISGSSFTESHRVPYNQNVGTLPNVLILGCFEAPSSRRLEPQNYSTFADLADGTLSTLPVWHSETACGPA